MNKCKDCKNWDYQGIECDFSICTLLSEGEYQSQKVALACNDFECSDLEIATRHDFGCSEFSRRESDIKN